MEVFLWGHSGRKKILPAPPTPPLSNIILFQFTRLKPEFLKKVFHQNQQAGNTIFSRQLRNCHLVQRELKTKLPMGRGTGYNTTPPLQKKKGKQEKGKQEEGKRRRKKHAQKKT